MAEHGFVKQVRIDRLGDVVVHAFLQAALPFLGHRMGGHGDDRQAVVALVGADSDGRLVAVHDRHLHVHQHDIERGRVTFRDFLDRLAAVVDDFDLSIDLGQKFDGDLLVDLVVFGQQNANAAHIGKVLALSVGAVARQAARA